MLSKLFRNRNRKVVRLPQEALEVLGLRDDMVLDVVVDAQNCQVVLRSVEKKIDPELAQKIAGSLRLQNSHTGSLAPKNRLI